jgi:hypothetical protein
VATVVATVATAALVHRRPRSTTRGQAMFRPGLLSSAHRDPAFSDLAHRFSRSRP